MREYVIPVMIISFLSDFLLLSGAGRLAETRTDIRSCGAASLIGAVYRCVCLVSKMGILNHVFLRLVCFFIVGMIAFGWKSSAVRPAVLFTVLEMALLGIISGSGRGNVLSVLFGCIAIWLLCRVSCNMRSEKIIPVELTNKGKTIKISALVDTGNLLTDPMTGKDILVVCNEVGMNLAGLTEKQISNPVQTLVTHPELRLGLMPYRTVGNDNGMLLTMRIESVKLAGKKAGRMIAFAPTRLSRNREYQALAGGCFV